MSPSTGRQRLRAGESDAEILSFLESRYGDFVRMTPPLRSTTWALWFGPALIMLLAVASLVWLATRRRQQPENRGAEPLSDAEQARAEALLAEKDRQ